MVASIAVVALQPGSKDEMAAGRSAEDELIQLMRDFERSIYSFLFTLLRDEQLALDSVQDTFLRAFENLQRGKPVNTAWLYKVARNRAMDEFRRSKRMSPDADALEHVPVDRPTDTIMAVQHILDLLSPMDREVLYLFDIAGFKTDEIGKLLGVRGSAIRQRLTRARERFRSLYGAES
jgi:RNA polymerase sigma-70 factor, ECF subfamily